MEVYGDIDIATDIRIRKMRWGHIQHLRENRDVKWVFASKPGGSTSRGRPKLRGLEGALENLRKIKIESWKSKTQNRDK